MQPQCFMDNRQILWTLHLDMGKAAEIEQVDFSRVTKLQISLLDPPKEMWTELYSRTALRFALVYYICRPQCQHNLKIDPYSSPQENERAEREFLRGIDGNNKEAVLKALHEALTDFFPDQKTGLDLARANWERTRLLVEQQIPELAPKMDKMLERRIKDMYQKIGTACDSDDADEIQRILTAEFGKTSTPSMLDQDSPFPSVES